VRRELMAGGLHRVVLYRDDESKRFSITARMDRARLPGVDAQMAARGYTRHELAACLDKAAAEALRDRERVRWEAEGYTYQTRPQLS
jgi:hypothetical protein